MRRPPSTNPIYLGLQGTDHPGVYIIQSEVDRSCYRIGAAGTQTGKTGSLFKRLTQHHRHACPNRRDVDWTQHYRCWDILWAMCLPGASKLTVRLVEALVFGHFAARYSFLPESDGSGFTAPADAASHIPAEARALEPMILQISRLQATFIDRPLWLKGDTTRGPSFVDRKAPA